MHVINLFLAILAHSLYSTSIPLSRMEGREEIFPVATEKATIPVPDLNFQTRLSTFHHPLRKNQKYLVKYLYKISSSTRSPQLVELLNIFSKLSMSQYSKRLAILTPQQYGVFPLTQSQNIYFLLTQRLPIYCLDEANNSHKFTLIPQWLGYSHQKKSYLPDYESHTSGFSVIHTYQDSQRFYNITPMSRITYLYTTTKWIKKMGKATTQNFYYHPSLSFSMGESFTPALTLLLGYNHHWLRRGIYIESPSSVSTAFSSWEISESLDLLYQYYFHSLTMLPELILTQTNVFQSCIQEKHKKGLPFQIKSRIFSYLDILCTLRIQRQKISHESCVTPSFAVGWHRAIQLTTPFLSSKTGDFSACASHFLTETYTAIPHSVYIQPRLDLSYRKEAAISLSCTNEYGNKRWSCSLVWQASWSF